MVLRRILSNRTLIYAMVVGAVFGLFGAAYGAFLYFSPEYRESIIREQLQRPHPDSQRYVARVVSLRYETLASLVVLRSVWPAIAGLCIGALLGRWHTAGTRQTQEPSFIANLTNSLVTSALPGIAMLAVVFAFAPMHNHGLVYVDGKDQFDWLVQLEYGTESEKREAMAAFTVLLQEPAFPCRSTIIPALAESGPIARPALGVLQELTTDTEEPVRAAAQEAVKQLSGT